MPTRKPTGKRTTLGWLSRQDLRAEFNIALPTMTIRRWMKQKKFPLAHRVDGEDLWRASVIRAWLRGQR